MKYKSIKIRNSLTGFTLIETLIGITIFAILATFTYSAYSNITNIISQIKLRSQAISILNNEIEIMRNIPYQDIGIQGGSPSGIILAEQTIYFGNIPFLLKTTIRNIDDPFDGIIGGSPNDMTPADYKFVELEISSPSRSYYYKPVKLATTFAPKNLETATNNGALFVNVFDAFGQPVKNANVSIINNQLNPLISINDSTNNDGILQLVDIPTSTNAYEIKATKGGYSSAQTYPIGAPENPNPIVSHATVVSQQVTNASFAIDKVSNIDFKTVNAMCQPVPNVSFSLNGAKLIGQNPDVLKYSKFLDTGLEGIKNITNLEWDTYDFSNLDANYDLSGYYPFSPIVLNPNSSVYMSWLMTPKNPSALLITVQDVNNQLINDVSVKLAKTGFEQILYSGRRSFFQTDWSNNQYSSQSGDVDADSNPGEMKLKIIDDQYPTSTPNWLISSTFDLGVQAVNFYNLSWQPANQPPETEPDSLLFQIAANNDNTTWNFLGPDGAPDSFYSASDTQIYSGHDNNRYLRYKVFLKTANENFTPTLDEIRIDFHSSCVPDGQVFFNGLANEIYSLIVEKSGYQTFTNPNLSVSQNWQEYKITLQNQ